MTSGTIAAIALGSNLGDRRAHLDFAAASLASRLSGLRVSRYYETDPVDVEPQPRFLNAAAVGVYDGGARDLLQWMLQLERQRDRVRPYTGAARTLDLDLILFGGVILDQTGLRVPHPRFRTRRFVLEPLAEIAPELRDPETEMSVSALLARLPQG